MDVDHDGEPVPQPLHIDRQISEDPPRASSLPLHLSELTVGYVYSSEMMQHYSPQGHPEQPERISRIMQAIKAAHYHGKMKRLPIRPVKRDEALLVHSEDHWDKVQAIQCKSSANMIASRTRSNQYTISSHDPARDSIH
jgi:histone deacetylase 6